MHLQAAVRLVYCYHTIVQLDIVQLVVHLGTTKGTTYFTEYNYKIVIGEIFIN